MESSILSQSDINYYMQQSKGKLNMIICGMTELLSDNDRKIEMLETQTWYQRMARTLTGRNKMTKREIERNHEKINAYISQAITELYKQNCLDREIIMDLGSRLNDLAAAHLQIKQVMGAFIAKLNEKIESVDNFHLLMEEIELGFFQKEQAMASLFKMIPFIDRRIALDQRKLMILQRNLENQGFFLEEEKKLEIYLMEVMNIPSEDIGALYLDLKVIQENKNARAILYVIEHYHFLSESEQKVENREDIARQAVKSVQESRTMRWTTKKLFLNLLKSKAIRATFELAKDYDEGRGIEVDSSKAVELYKEAAEQGHVGAQCNLGVSYYLGKGVEEDKEEAVKWYRKAAEQGQANAQYNLGDCYYLGRGVEEDEEEAVKWYRKAAEQGQANAQNRLGDCYDLGKGVEEDKEEAVKWYRKAAEQGYAKAQCNLGISYCLGRGVEEDEEKAVKWYRKAAEQGHVGAQCSLGVCYEYGRGVEEDEEEAVKWYQKAAEQGLASAQYNLGICYDYGKGVEEDKEEAVKWYRKAAEQGDADAQYNLGYSYSNGEGVEKDEEEAVKWYRKAAEQGYEKAKKILFERYFIRI